MATVDITNETLVETIQNNGIVLVGAWVSWCGSCRQFAPICEKTSEKHSKVVFAKLDTDVNQEVSAAPGIQLIPMLFVSREGVPLFQHSGVLPETALSDLIDQTSELNMDDVRAQIVEQAAQDSATE